VLRGAHHRAARRAAHRHGGGAGGRGAEGGLSAPPSAAWALGYKACTGTMPLAGSVACWMSRCLEAPCMRDKPLPWGATPGTWPRHHGERRSPAGGHGVFRSRRTHDNPVSPCRPHPPKPLHLETPCNPEDDHPSAAASGHCPKPKRRPNQRRPPKPPIAQRRSKPRNTPQPEQPTCPNPQPSITLHHPPGPRQRAGEPGQEPGPVRPGGGHPVRHPR
jgi:hypothetical protein